MTLKSYKETILEEPQRLKLVKSFLEKKLDKSFSTKTLSRFIKKLNGTWKRIRRRLKDKTDAGTCALKKQALSDLNKLASRGEIDLFYGDETGVSETGYVPYGWQFSKEELFVPCRRGKSRSYFGLISRDNRCFYESFTGSVRSENLIGFLDRFAQKCLKPTTIVLDNASIHTSKKFKECLKGWKSKNLHIFYLPTYSPHLNIIERLWKELKEGWLRPQDYETADGLFYAVDRALAAVGKDIGINFSAFDCKIDTRLIIQH